jgi:hypothetical protein
MYRRHRLKRLLFWYIEDVAPALKMNVEVYSSVMKAEDLMAYLIEGEGYEAT